MIKALKFITLIFIVVTTLINCFGMAPYPEEEYYFGKWKYLDEDSLNINGNLELNPDNTFKSSFSYFFTEDSNKCCDSLEGDWEFYHWGGPNSGDGYDIQFSVDSISKRYNFIELEEADTILVLTGYYNTFKFILVKRYEP